MGCRDGDQDLAPLLRPEPGGIGPELLSVRTPLRIAIASQARPRLPRRCDEFYPGGGIVRSKAAEVEDHALSSSSAVPGNQKTSPWLVSVSSQKNGRRG